MLQQIHLLILVVRDARTFAVQLPAQSKVKRNLNLDFLMSGPESFCSIRSH